MDLDELWRFAMQGSYQSWGVRICMHFLWGKLTLLKCEYLTNGWMDLDEFWRFGKLTFYATSFILKEL